MAISLPSAGRSLGAFALGSILLFAAPGIAGASGVFKQDADGLTIFSRASRPSNGAPAPDQAASHIRAALDILRRRSPDYYGALKTLNGPVFIQYAPEDHLLASLAGPLALFRSRTGVTAFDDTSRRSYVAVLGPRVIQWPAAELAGIIVHELIGHGRQHAENRLRSMSAHDRECEARLHQLRVYQDLGIASSDATMAAFRTSLQDVWCRGFSGYLSASWPGAHDLWSEAGLDGEQLLVAFDTYRQYGARIRGWGQGQWTAGSFDDLLPGSKEPKTNPAARSLAGARRLIAHARQILGNPSL